MIPALAFVPLDSAVVYFEELAYHLRNVFNEDCDNLLDSFGDKFISRFKQNAPRRAPLFSINLRNMFHRTFDELPSTTSCIERWHRSFQATAAACYPTFWNILKLLKKEDALNRVETLQTCGGHSAPLAGRRYVDANQRLTQVVDSFQKHCTGPRFKVNTDTYSSDIV